MAIEIVDSEFERICELKSEIEVLQKDIINEIERIHDSVIEFEEMLDAFQAHFWNKSTEIMEKIEELMEDYKDCNYDVIDC